MMSVLRGQNIFIKVMKMLLTAHLTFVLLVFIIVPTGTYYANMRMIIKTRVFEMAYNKFPNLSGLARAMGLSVSQVYRVREGKRGINEKFIIGAKKAFPNHRLDDLFYFQPEKTHSRKPAEPVTASR
jgi:hypothetical protein